MPTSPYSQQKMNFFNFAACGLRDGELKRRPSSRRPNTESIRPRRSSRVSPQDDTNGSQQSTRFEPTEVPSRSDADTAGADTVTASGSATAEPATTASIDTQTTVNKP